MAINQQITSAPPAPQRSDPNTFADKADAFVAWLENLDDELNQWASECNSTEDNINDSEQTILQAKSDTLAARDQAVAEANAKVYDNSETYSYPDCVIGSDGHVYRCMGNNITGEDPVTSISGNWKRLSVALNSDKQLELPFAQTPILVNGQDIMSRTFYVDAENGDDNNDGASSTPFKTIKKACDSVPVGGYGLIYFFGGQVFNLDSIILQHKSLFFSRYNNDNNYIITTSYYQDNDAAWLKNFKLINSKLIFYHAIFDLPENTTGLNVSGHDNGLIQFKRKSVVSGVHFYNCTVNLNYNNNILISMHDYGDGASFSAISLYNVTFNINHSNTYFIGAGNAPFSLRKGANITVNDNTGNNRTFNDLIAGIVKDANGVPRNVISNIVF